MLKRYDLKNDKPGEGWAIIVIDTERGFFAAVSDWGNYAYLWSSPGCEFRKFLIGLDAHYLHGKLMHGRPNHHVFDRDATRDAILERIAELETETRQRQHAERSLLTGYQDEDGFQLWCALTGLEEPWGLRVTRPEPQCMSFCTRVFPRLVERLKAELASEVA
jgi:hypothetical protein